MAVTNRNSSAIANLVASPRVINSPPLAGGAAKVFPGVVASAADDSGTSVFRFCRIPSNAAIYSILLSAADASTAGAIDVGLYDTADNGSAVVDADYFASAVDLSGGPFSNAELVNESGTYTFAKQVQPLWQALGLSSDPCKDYDLCATVSTTFNGGPTSIKLVALGYV